MKTEMTLLEGLADFSAALAPIYWRSDAMSHECITSGEAEDIKTNAKKHSAKKENENLAKRDDGPALQCRTSTSI